jgi:hypothetical protein
LGPAKHDGIPQERLAWGLVFASLFGYTAGLRAVDTVSRADCGRLAGLPLLPAPSTPYRCLQDGPVTSALDCQTALGRCLVALTHGTPGPPVNIAGHNVQTSSRKAMPHAFITPEDRDGTARRPFDTPDQAAKPPRSALAASSGPTVSQVTPRVAGLPRAILGRDVLLVADTAWSCGPLIQALHAHYGVAVLPPGRSSPTRLGELDAVPLEPYDQTVWGHVAAVSTTMTDCDGPLRMLLKQRRDGQSCALITPACPMTADIAMPTDTTRWRLEHCLAENAFLGVHPLPSLHLNALQTMLSLRLRAFPVMDNCRHDLGVAYQQKTPALIHRECVNGVQGRGQLCGHIIAVIIDGCEHEAAAAAILTNLETKRTHAGGDPRIPWLGNRRLRCTLHSLSAPKVYTSTWLNDC